MLVVTIAAGIDIEMMEFAKFQNRVISRHCVTDGIPRRAKSPGYDVILIRINLNYMGV